MFYLLWIGVLYLMSLCFYFDLDTLCLMHSRFEFIICNEFWFILLIGVCFAVIVSPIQFGKLIGLNWIYSFLGEVVYFISLDFDYDLKLYVYLFLFTNPCELCRRIGAGWGSPHPFANPTYLLNPLRLVVSYPSPNSLILFWSLVCLFLTSLSPRKSVKQSGDYCIMQ